MVNKQIRQLVLRFYVACFDFFLRYVVILTEFIIYGAYVYF